MPLPRCLVLALVIGSGSEGAVPGTRPSGTVNAGSDASSRPVRLVTRGLPPSGGPPSTARTPPRGVPLFITGTILTGVGATLSGLAAVALAERGPCPRAGRCDGELLGLHLLASGLPALVAGLPLLAVGARRHRRWRAWERGQLRGLGPIRGGAAVWFELRF